MTTTTLKIQGMTCAHCAQRVKESLESLTGILAAHVWLETGEAVIDHGDELPREAMRKAVAEAGYALIG